MTIPTEPQPPTTIGTQPRNADEVNGLLGTHLRGFATNKVTINQDAAWLAVTDLKAAPYYFTDEQEATLKSAVADLDTSLDAIDMTFISRIIGI
jgi:hypothetical protein